MTSHRRLCRRARDDRGSAAIEAVIGVPAFLLFVGLIIFAGRVAVAHQAVESATSAAARSASIARTQQAAVADARSAAAANLTEQDIHCVTARVEVDAAGFGAPVGTPAAVTATVSCVVDLADLAVPGVPGTRTVTATMTSPIDTYRER
ncbi:pilus assembly protein [Intrasporangium calvum]|uniref:Pilus assembly protein n=1 Tax=Intrasporangium calvum TaxID=53358 RepID=A0ABT5GIU7_9MICO|nr:TadE family protein [Intrasporangium calvum]MDC5698072.1 pilus assembly protein [Intrasporangium calvum]